MSSVSNADADRSPIRIRPMRGDILVVVVGFSLALGFAVFKSARAGQPVLWQAFPVWAIFAACLLATANFVWFHRFVIQDHAVRRVRYFGLDTTIIPISPEMRVDQIVEVGSNFVRVPTIRIQWSNGEIKLSLNRYSAEGLLAFVARLSQEGASVESEVVRTLEERVNNRRRSTRAS